MCRTIYFADKILLFSSRPVGEPYHEIPLEAGTTLPQAKILNFLETFNFVAVVPPDPDRCFAAFAAAFRLVEAAGGAVVNDRGERLMIYRNGRWDLPKGHWERGETIEACALREVREETGVAASIRRHLCDTLHCYQLRGEWEMKRTHWFEMAAAADATLPLPITSDYRMARAFARRIDPSLVSVQGTAIGKALEQALLSFSGDTEESHGRVIILITDGENHDDDAIAVAERAAQMGVKIFTIGIGTPEGAPIQIGGEFIKDETGEMVVSKLNEEMLARIADITGGAYVRSSKQSIGLDEIVKAINEMEQTELSMVRFEEFNEQYQYLLIAALVLLLLEFLMLDRRNPLLAHLNIFREK